MKCPYCAGVLEAEICDDCDGTGGIEEECDADSDIETYTEECDTCHGTGTRYFCPTCKEEVTPW